MLILIKSMFVLLGLLAVFFALGSYAVFGNRGDSPGLAVIYGFVIYYFLFELPAVLFMLLQIRLHVLTIVWAVVLAVLVLGAVVRYSGAWKNCLRTFSRSTCWRMPVFWMMLVLILVQVVVVALRVDNNLDAAYYVANVSANLATDTINCYQPFTGVLQDSFYVRYLFGLYPVSNSVICDLTGLPPLVLTKTIQSVLTVLLSYLTYWLIGMRLLEGKRERVSLLLFFISLLNLNFHTVYSNATFLLQRGYEGKAVLANLLLPVVLCLGLKFHEDMRDRMVWLMFFMIGIAGVDLTMSSMTIIPVAVSAVLLPQIAVHRQWKLLVRYVVCMVPSVVIFAVYFLASKGYLSFPIRGLG